MEQQRLDKIIASTGRYSRREVKLLIRQGRVLVDGTPPPILRGEGGSGDGIHHRGWHGADLPEIYMDYAP